MRSLVEDRTTMADGANGVPNPWAYGGLRCSLYPAGSICSRPIQNDVPERGAPHWHGRVTHVDGSPRFRSVVLSARRNAQRHNRYFLLIGCQPDYGFFAAYFLTATISPITLRPSRYFLLRCLLKKSKFVRLLYLWARKWVGISSYSIWRPLQTTITSRSSSSRFRRNVSCDGWIGESSLSPASCIYSRVRICYSSELVCNILTRHCRSRPK